MFEIEYQVYLIVELMVTHVPILQIHKSYEDGSSNVMEVRWLNSAKKTVALTCNKIRFKAVNLVLSVWLCILK